MQSLSAAVKTHFKLKRLLLYSQVPSGKSNCSSFIMSKIVQRNTGDIEINQGLDDNGFKAILLADGTVTIESIDQTITIDGDITINTTGNIEVNSDGDVDVTAGGNRLDCVKG